MGVCMYTSENKTTTEAVYRLRIECVLDVRDHANDGVMHFSIEHWHSRCTDENRNFFMFPQYCSILRKWNFDSIKVQFDCITSYPCAERFPQVKYFAKFLPELKQLVVPILIPKSDQWVGWSMKLCFRLTSWFHRFHHQMFVEEEAVPFSIRSTAVCRSTISLSVNCGFPAEWSELSVNVRHSILRWSWGF